MEVASGDQVGADRLPSLAFASDHLTLAADFKLVPAFSLKYQDKRA
jgi:hypothetical protein